MSEPQREMFRSVENPETVSPQEALRRARPLPSLEDSVIDNLSEEEELVFWETIVNA